MSPEDLNSLEQYFVTNINEHQYELKENGASIIVNQDNVREFLDLLAVYHIKTHHEKSLKAIKKGFEQIFPLVVN